MLKKLLASQSQHWEASEGSWLWLSTANLSSFLTKMANVTFFGLCKMLINLEGPKTNTRRAAMWATLAGRSSPEQSWPNWKDCISKLILMSQGTRLCRVNGCHGNPDLVKWYLKKIPPPEWFYLPGCWSNKCLILCECCTKLYSSYHRQRQRLIPWCG